MARRCATGDWARANARANHPSLKFHLLCGICAPCEKYVQALRSAAATESPLSKYYLHELIDRIETEPGQYFADPYLDRLCDILKAYRSDDSRTMFVGITEANIYSGDNNFLFSLSRVKSGSRAGILSCHMMLASSMNENYESRQRLTERIAKELVPASLKQLDIPRSTDPRCPYSYSSGVSRLDEKTLKLSDSVKRALRKFKSQPEDAAGKQQPR